MNIFLQPAPTFTEDTGDFVVPAVKLPKSLKCYLGKETGIPAKGDRVSVDTPMSVAQRDYSETEVLRKIREVGGINWDDFGYATAVKYVDGELRIVDAQHRIGAVKTILPHIKEVPAQIIDLTHLPKEQAVKYAAERFSVKNGIGVRSIKSEDTFWTDVIREDADALKVKSILEKCDLSCGKVNKDVGRKQVKYANFVKCVKMGEDATVRAAYLINKAYPSAGMNDNLLSGLTRLLSHMSYQELSDPLNKVSEEFEDWFTDYIPEGHQITELGFAQYRNTNNWYDGVAYGLIKKFAHYQRNKNRYVPSVDAMEKIYKAGIKETASA